MVCKNTRFLVHDLKFKRSSNDPFLYAHHKGSNKLILASYVDDLLIAGYSKSESSTLKGKLSSKFEMKDLRQAIVILGIKMKRSGPIRHAFVSQSEYTKEGFKRFRKADCRHVATPTEQ